MKYKYNIDTQLNNDGILQYILISHGNSLQDLVLNAEIFAETQQGDEAGCDPTLDDQSRETYEAAIFAIVDHIRQNRY